MPVATVTEPVLLELDHDTWKGFLDRLESWLGNVLMLQITFRQQAEDILDKIEEPHIHEYLRETAEIARQHEQRAKDLYGLIGRSVPTTTRGIGATLMSEARQVLADVQGMTGGAKGGWNDLRMLMVTNLETIGAFGTAQDLGLALANPDIFDLCFDVVNEKTTQQLLLQEYMLEMSAVAVLYQENT